MAGSWSTTVYNQVRNSELKTITFTFIGSADDGTVPDHALTTTELEFMTGTQIMDVETIPGTPAPDNSWLPTLEDVSGDIVEFTARSQARQHFTPTKDGVGNYVPIDGRALTLKIAANTVVSATAQIRFTLARL